MEVQEMEAIKKTKELWALIKKSGMTKVEFLNKPENSHWFEYDCQCPLCHYVDEEAEGGRQNPGDKPCREHCPLMKQYGEDCYRLGFIKPTPDWFKKVEGLVGEPYEGYLLLTDGERDHFNLTFSNDVERMVRSMSRNWGGCSTCKSIGTKLGLIKPKKRIRAVFISDYAYNRIFLDGGYLETIDSYMRKYNLDEIHLGINEELFNGVFQGIENADTIELELDDIPKVTKKRIRAVAISEGLESLGIVDQFAEIMDDVDELHIGVDQGAYAMEKDGAWVAISKNPIIELELDDMEVIEVPKKKVIAVAIDDALANSIIREDCYTSDMIGAIERALERADEVHLTVSDVLYSGNSFMELSNEESPIKLELDDIVACGDFVDAYKTKKSVVVVAIKEDIIDAFMKDEKHYLYGDGAIRAIDVALARADEVHISVVPSAYTGNAFIEMEYATEPIELELDEIEVIEEPEEPESTFKANPERAKLAVVNAITIWSKIVAGGEGTQKSDVEESDGYHNRCPLCQYVLDSGAPRLNEEACKDCPYTKYMGYHCEDEQSAFSKWDDGDDDEEEYAEEFLQELCDMYSNMIDNA